MQWHTCRTLSSKRTFCNSFESEVSIDSEIVRNASKKTQGHVDPMTFDVDGWRWIIISENFGTSGEHLREAITGVAKKYGKMTELKILKHFELVD